MTRLAETVVWWAVGIGVWLLTLSSMSAPEVVAAVVAALPCAVLAVAARRAVEGSWAPQLRRLRQVLPLPVAVGADTVRLLGRAAAVLAGHPIPAGDLREVRLERDRGAERWAAHQATAVALVSASPGSVALHVDEKTGQLLLHMLGSGRPRMEEVVRR